VIFVQRTHRILPVVGGSGCGGMTHPPDLPGIRATAGNIISVISSAATEMIRSRYSIAFLARRSRCRMTVVIFQIVPLIWNEKLVCN